MQNLDKYLGVLAAIVIGSAQIIYIINTIKKKITPSPLSWFGWACLMGTSVISQTVSKGWQYSLTSIVCSTIGCLTISSIALITRNYSFRKKDLQFLLFGLICIGIYVWSANPWITTTFAIIADGILGIPTLLTALRNPASERSIAWRLGVISSTLALITCIGHDLIYYLFPCYLFLFNGAMALLTTRIPAAEPAP